MLIQELMEAALSKNEKPNQFGVLYSSIRPGDFVYLMDDSTGRRISYEVVKKSTFPNGMLSLIVKDKKGIGGRSQANFLDVEKVKKKA